MSEDFIIVPDILHELFMKIFTSNYGSFKFIIHTLSRKLVQAVYNTSEVSLIILCNTYFKDIIKVDIIPHCTTLWYK